MQELVGFDDLFLGQIARFLHMEAVKVVSFLGGGLKRFRRPADKSFGLQAFVGKKACRHDMKHKIKLERPGILSKTRVIGPPVPFKVAGGN